MYFSSIYVDQYVYALEEIDGIRLFDSTSQEFLEKVPSKTSFEVEIRPTLFFEFYSIFRVYIVTLQMCANRQSHFLHSLLQLIWWKRTKHTQLVNQI